MINGTTIRCCNVITDLGVQIDSQLNFHAHTTGFTKKANGLVAIICLITFEKNVYTNCNLYKTYIRLVLQYGNAIWGPQYIF